ncbi:hypothetical protein QUF99_06165 [Bacillus sp. DX4.1]|uniref:hypothetical protein n=1 Tax=Bacillus sp. DX4.1 TaxID=3055867 RepID=UPI0025A1C20E|nr:hypothetical protein [Bacillus sp. DX4.1]MDM5186954.1 hypothetical protein [Bacillus sp. DX4.1]
MIRDKRLKVLHVLYVLPFVLSVMCFLNSSMNSLPYSKLIGTISGCVAAIMLALFWTVKLQIKRDQAS